jgi:hypothetical protein
MKTINELTTPLTDEEKKCIDDKIDDIVNKVIAEERKRNLYERSNY